MPLWNTVACLLGWHPHWTDVDPLGVQRCVVCGYARVLCPNGPDAVAAAPPCQHRWVEQEYWNMTRADGTRSGTRFKLRCTICGDLTFRESDQVTNAP